MSYVELDTVFCDVTVSRRIENASDAMAHIQVDVGDIFAKRVMMAFNSGKTAGRQNLARLCNCMDKDLLEQLGVSAKAYFTICEKFETSLAERKTSGTTPKRINEKLRNLQSKLFPYKELGDFSQPAQFDLWCRPAFSTVPLQHLDLSYEIIQKHVCPHRLNTPLAIESAVAGMVEAMSDIFATQLLHASQDDEYADFVCQALMEDGLIKGSLDPQRVKHAFCSYERKRGGDEA